MDRLTAIKTILSNNDGPLTVEEIHKNLGYPRDLKESTRSRCEAGVSSGLFERATVGNGRARRVAYTLRGRQAKFAAKPGSDIPIPTVPQLSTVSGVDVAAVVSAASKLGLMSAARVWLGRDATTAELINALARTVEEKIDKIRAGT